jgi:hypothetical protein
MNSPQRLETDHKGEIHLQRLSFLSRRFTKSESNSPNECKRSNNCIEKDDDRWQEASFSQEPHVWPTHVMCSQL